MSLNRKRPLIPSKVYVGHDAYRIKFVKGFRDRRKVGDCDPEKKLIRVLRGMGYSATLKTIIHELLHALEFEYDLPLKHRLIYKLEEPILKLILDNFL